jgi:CheY-like chemotaxis protein
MSTVLLIDAEKEFAQPISQAINSWGYQCKWVQDGKDGLDSAAQMKPDAIILCVELPKMSGYSLCNKLKKDESLKGIPLIITSREATPETFEQHKKLKTRAEAYLIKPFKPAELQTLLGQFVRSADPLGGELKALDLLDDSKEQDIVLDDLPQGAEEQTLSGLDEPSSGDSHAIDNLDGISIASEDDEPEREATRIMTLPQMQQAPAKPTPAPKPVAVAAAAAPPAATVATVATAAARPAPAAKPIGNDERSQLEAKLAEAKTKASSAAAEVDKLRAEMNQVRTKAREESAALRKQVQELTEKLKADQQSLKSRYEETSQKALTEAAQLRQQVKDVQGRAQAEMEQLRTQLIEMRNQSQDLLTQKDSEVGKTTSRLQQLEAQVEALKSEQNRAQKVRERMQKAVDVAWQLLSDGDDSSNATP